MAPNLNQKDHIFWVIIFDLCEHNKCEIPDNNVLHFYKSLIFVEHFDWTLSCHQKI